MKTNVVMKIMLQSILGGLLSGCALLQDRTEPPVRTAVVSPTQGHKLLLMHYMPWYKTPDVRGSWGPHWTGFEHQHDPEALRADGLPDLYSHFNPLIGAYDSTDPDVLECQLLQMKLAGVDGVLADWYGIGNLWDYPEMHEATRILFDEAERLGLSVSVCYEDRTMEMLVKQGVIESAQITNHLVETFAWMDSEWFGKPNYVYWQDRPLVLNFGPVYLNWPEIWNAARDPLSPRPLLFGLHHLWRKAGGDGGFTWVHYEPFENRDNPDEVKTRLNEVYSYFSKNPTEVIVSAWPGFRDNYPAGQHHPILEHRDGLTMQQTLDVAMQGPWSIIQLITWNDYGEGTMIEPTEQFGYRFLEIIQKARRVESKGTFPYTPDDLRLPAQLLALRREGRVPEAKLDALADALADGKINKARSLLEKAETVRE